MVLKVDLWSTGFRGDIVQRPLVEALHADGRIEQRIVYCGQTPALAAMTALPVPQCQSAGTASISKVPALLPHILRARRALTQFYGADARDRIVHVTMASPWDQFYLDIPYRAGAKILLVIHDAQRHIGEESWFADRLEARLISMADHLAVLSPYAGEMLPQRIGSATPIHVVSPGLVMDSTPPGPAKPAPSGRPFRFLFFGRIHAYKGLDMLLEAWARFRAMPGAAPATLSIVGSGNVDPYREHMAASPDVEAEIGWVSDARMAEVFATHDINMLPYREGSESATALAGMWAGMPAIATDVGCFKEKLIDNENALLTAFDADAIAAAMQRIATSPDLYSRLAQGTHAMAQRWSAPYIADQWVELYRRITGSAA